MAELSELEKELAATLAASDEPVRAQVTRLVETELRPKAEKLRSELRYERSEEIDRAAREAEWLLSHYRGMLQTARVHSEMRRRAGVEESQVVADRVVAELGPPQNVASPPPPPVAVLGDVSNDRLRESPLADSTLFVPRTVREDPSHWSFLAPEIARYLEAAAPTLYQEIYEELELAVPEAEIARDPEALTRVLFASWIGRIVSDAVGALLFGPSYLVSLTELYAQPQVPGRVTSIVINPDGTVHNEPPAHVRVHATARWLSRMGYGSEASAILRDWDERHGSPTVLPFWGSTTSLPAAPILGTVSELMGSLFQLPLAALGKVRLAQVPTLSGWENLARQAKAAKRALLSGERAVGSARAIVAGAIEAALESPEANAAISAALYDSLALPAQRAVVVPAAPDRVSPAPGATAFANLTGRDYAEALILDEILLQRR